MTNILFQPTSRQQWAGSPSKACFWRVSQRILWIW